MLDFLKLVAERPELQVCVVGAVVFLGVWLWKLAGGLPSGEAAATKQIAVIVGAIVAILVREIVAAGGFGGVNWPAVVAQLLPVVTGAMGIHAWAKRRNIVPTSDG